MPNLLAMAVTEPHLNELSFAFPWSIATICICIFSIDPCSLVVEGVPPHQRHHQIPSSAQTHMTIYDLFSPLLSIVTLDEATIKHSLYTQKVHFLFSTPIYTENACVLFSQF